MKTVYLVSTEGCQIFFGIYVYKGFIRLEISKQKVVLYQMWVEFVEVPLCAWGPAQAPDLLGTRILSGTVAPPTCIPEFACLEIVGLIK